MTTDKKKPASTPVQQAKSASHPWRAWNPGAFKRRAAPCSYKETLKGVTAKNRAI